jgi:hypothetical protein
MDELQRQRQGWMKDTEYDTRFTVAVLSGGFGFTANRIMAAIERPDREPDRIAWGDWFVRVGAKASGNDAIGERTDVVGLALSGGVRQIVFAFEAFPDLCEAPIEGLHPLQIVEALAERFGFAMTIGGKTGTTGKFFLKETITRPPRRPRGRPIRDYLDVKYPKDETPFIVRLDDADDRIIQVTLAFCISQREYGRWVENQPSPTRRSRRPKSSGP